MKSQTENNSETNIVSEGCRVCVCHVCVLKSCTTRVVVCEVCVLDVFHPSSLREAALQVKTVDSVIVKLTQFSKTPGQVKAQTKAVHQV